MSPVPTPCDGFAQSIALRVDRELGPAEAARLDAHLDGCARCQSRVHQLVALSATLKRWDAETAPVRPPLERLKNAVLAEVADQGVVRRAEGRRGRYVGLSLAASVLFALGTAVGLGLQGPSAAPSSTPETTARGPLVEPAPEPEPLVVSLPGGRVLPELPVLGEPGLPIPSPKAPPLFSHEDREAALAAALPAQMRLEEETRFRSVTGSAPVRVTDRLGRGGEMLVTELAAVFLQDLESRGVFAEVIRAREDRRTEPPPPDRKTLRGPADVLGWIPASEKPDWSKVVQLVRQFSVGPSTAKQVPQLNLRGLPSAPVVASTGEDFLDPVEAWQSHVLSFQESVGDDYDVIAIVKDSARPILLPAGHLLGGGVTDRIVAHSTWLPASRGGTKQFRVPCLSVRQGSGRDETEIRPTAFVGGPSLRALLARDADPSEVLRHVGAFMEAQTGSRRLEWSLLDLYRNEAYHVAAQDRVKTEVEATPQGFVATDAAHGYLGVESTTLRGEAARLLVRRLWYGYVMEAFLRAARPAQNVLPDPVGPWKQALAQIRGNRAMFLKVLLPPDAQVEGAESATLEDEVAGLVYETLQVDGRAVLVSALPR